MIHRIRYAIIVWLCFLVFPSLLFSGVDDWQTITNKSRIEDMAVYQNWLICATGGGVVVYDRNTGQHVASFTNTDGLSNNHPVQIVVDGAGNWWLGMSNGDLNLFDQETQQWRVFSDFSRFTIHDMDLKGDSMFVALDIGVSVFLLEKEEAKETYKNLGSIPVEVDVNTSFIQNHFIWVGTDYGVAYADLNQVNLKAPQSWHNLTTDDGLASNVISAIHGLGDAVFVGTKEGVQKYQDGQWTSYPDLPSKKVRQFIAKDGKLYLALKNRLYEYDPVNDIWQFIVYSPHNLSSVVLADDGTFWLGTEDTGLFRVDGATKELTEIPLQGPRGNYFYDLAVSDEGVLWCTSGSLFGKGVYRFDGVDWSNFFAKQNDFPADNTTAIVIDTQNQVWIGSWGRGVYRYADGKFSIYNAQNNYLPGIPNDLNYAVVNALAVDYAGTVWITNFAAYNGNKLTAVTLDSQWIAFGAVDGIIAANPLCITVDLSNRKWVGTDGGGVYVFDDNSTPTDKTDDRIAGTLTEVDGLESNRITAIAVDDFNTVWIGTNSGLNYFQDGRVYTKYGLITNDINCISVDPVGNKWIGTSTGFSILDRDEQTFKHYTIDNSPLASSNVLSIDFNRKTGTAYIGTSNGLSVFGTLFVEPQETLQRLSVFPNPFVIGEMKSGAVLVIDRLSRDCDVNIYSPAGFLVRTLVSGTRGGRAVWDGRDDNGEWVASGVYLAVAVQQDGKSGSAKVVVIRK
ncbi:MAG TPA: hypothetical protein ENH29_10005 [Bacteroidetes bacterium]|nr:hypothetical protein [Bacteroidota bacterium]